jgi:hypothetical protein
MCSCFSGRCDLYDSLIDIGKVTDFSKVHIYIKYNPVELRIDSYKDLIPYFPCVPSISTHSNREYRLCISGKPWYRVEEEQTLNFYLRDLTTCYNKLKREKRLSLEALIEMHTERFRWISNKNGLIDELARRLIEAKGNKDKVYIEDLYLPSGDWFRKKLYEEMIKNGWNENVAYNWCYGWDRWTERGKDEESTN